MIAEEVLNSLPKQQDAAMVSDENLTRQQLAERWQKSIGSINNYVNRGLITPIKLGRSILFPMSEVLKAEANGLTKFRGGR